MEKCFHDVNQLVPSGAGFVCRKCGKVFPNFHTLHADLEADRNGQEIPTAAEPEKAEKPKRTRKKREDA